MSDTDSRLTVLDLFCGAGGLSTGFEQAGFDTIGGIDQDAQAIETWVHNHDGTGIVADMTHYTPARLLEDIDSGIGEPTVVVGGPPCQDFSRRNQKLDLGRRHLVTLYGEYIRAIEPDAFVMENVGQLEGKHSDVLDSFYEALTDSYTISHRRLDAADYGVPQHRIRAFVIGIRVPETDRDTDVLFPRPTHGPDSDGGDSLKTAGEALAGIEPPGEPNDYRVTSKHADLVADIPPGMNYSFYTEKRGHPEPEFGWRSRFSDFLYKADPEKPVRTLTAQPGAGSGPFHWDNRRFTEPELKRLQSFPDAFEIPHGYTAVVKQIGNSVPPAMATAIARAVSTQLGETTDERIGLVRADTKLGFHARKRTSSDEYNRKTRERLETLGLA
jgi:DNA (cytosine-5)-methyltransferase 1